MTETPRFHPCPVAPGCPHCVGTPTPIDGVDAVYCISLQSRPDRTARAARMLHRMGLCRQALFYRPVKRRRSPKKAIWDSHRAVAAHARAAGRHRILVLEDDAVFRPASLERLRRVLGRTWKELPADWMGLYLGHWVLEGRFRAPDLVEVSSLCTHAYVASPRLLDWLVQHSWRDFDRESCAAKLRFRGGGIDAAFANLSGMYAVYPMLAFQDGSHNDHKHKSHVPGELSLYALKHGLRHHLVSRCMRINERLVLTLPRIRFATASWRRLRSQRPVATGTHGIR